MSDDLYQKMEKDAGIFNQLASGVRGAWGAGRRMATSQTARAAEQHALDTLNKSNIIDKKIVDPEHGMLGNLKERWQAARQGGAGGFAAQRGTEQAARQVQNTAAHERQLSEAAQVARNAGHEVPLMPHETQVVRGNQPKQTVNTRRVAAPAAAPAQAAAPATAPAAAPAAAAPAAAPAAAAPAAPAAAPAAPAAAAPAAPAAAPAAPAAAAPAAAPAAPAAAAPAAPAAAPAAPAAAAPAAAPAAPFMDRMRGHGAAAWDAAKTHAPAAWDLAKTHAPGAAAGAAITGLGAAAYRGSNDSAEQQARMRDYMANAHYMQPQALPSMTVMASYDEFARNKHAAFGRPTGPDSFGPMHSAFSKSLADTLSRKLVEEPIDNFHRLLKKKIVDDPKADNTFHAAIAADPMLQQAYKNDPESLHQTFSAMKKFGPSMVTSPGAVKSFLRQSAVSGGNMDFATIRLLAETEKFIQNSRGKGNSP